LAHSNTIPSSLSTFLPKATNSILSALSPPRPAPATN